MTKPVVLPKGKWGITLHGIYELEDLTTESRLSGQKRSDRLKNAKIVLLENLGDGEALTYDELLDAGNKFGGLTDSQVLNALSSLVKEKSVAPADTRANAEKGSSILFDVPKLPVIDGSNSNFRNIDWNRAKEMERGKPELG